MRKIHRHRHRPSRTTTHGWGQCVAPRVPHSAAAHGCVIQIDYCECGAIRRRELNGRREVRGPWEAPDAPPELTPGGGATPPPQQQGGSLPRRASVARQVVLFRGLGP